MESVGGIRYCTEQMFDKAHSRLEEGLRRTPVGSDLAKLVETLDSTSLSERERIELISAQRRLASHYLAQSYRQISVHFDHNIRLMPSEMDLAALQTEVEVGTALHLTGRSARFEFEIAWGLSRLPEVWASFDRGDIDNRRARVLVDYLSHLDKSESSFVLERVLDDAPYLTTGQLRARLAKLCLMANPDESKLRYQNALGKRRVESRATEQGTAELTGADPDRAEAAYRRLTHLARKLKRKGESRTIDQLRADLLLDLLLGTEQPATTGHRGSVDIRVDLKTLAGLNEAPGDLQGFGPVVSDIARQVTARQHDCRWSFTVTDPQTGLPLHQGVTRRRPRTAVRQAVQAHNPTCIFPGCRMPAQRCDLDHRRLYSQGGLTCEDNLAPLCRRHHRVRHLLAWQHRPLPGGDHLWTSAIGRKYTTSGRSP